MGLDVPVLRPEGAETKQPRASRNVDELTSHITTETENEGERRAVAITEESRNHFPISQPRPRTRSHAPRGNAVCDALRRLASGRSASSGEASSRRRGASTAFHGGPWERGGASGGGDRRGVSKSLPDITTETRELVPTLRVGMPSSTLRVVFS